MKILYILIIIFSIMTHSNAQTNPFHLKKDHDAIEVKDMEASVRFYGGLLGLQEIPNGGLPDHIRWFQLANGVQLHLIESDNIPETQKGVHMAFNTNRLEELMQFLKEKNIHFENWPGEPETTNTRPDGIRQIYFQDPDGYWIEVNDASF